MSAQNPDAAGLLVGAFCLMSASLRRRRQREEEEQEAAEVQQRKRTCWSRSWLMRREVFGQYDTLMTELLREDLPGYKNFLRVCPELFNELLEKISHRIEKQETFWRAPLSPGLRLAVTLRYLATGKCFN